MKMNLRKVTCSSDNPPRSQISNLECVAHAVDIHEVEVTSIIIMFLIGLYINTSNHKQNHVTWNHTVVKCPLVGDANMSQVLLYPLQACLNMSKQAYLNMTLP